MFNFRNYKIGTRLIATTLGALFMMLAFVGVALFTLSNITDKVEHLVNGNFKKSELAVEMRTQDLLIGRHVRTALILEETEKQNDEKQKVDANIAKYLAAESQLQTLLDDPNEKEVFEQIVVARQAAIETIKQMFVLIKAGNRPEIEDYFFNTFRTKIQNWADVVEKYEGIEREKNAVALTEIDQLKSVTQTTMLLLIGVALIVMIPSGLWVTRQITSPLRDAVRVAEAVAAGGFDNQMDLTGADEAAEVMLALDKMQKDLKARRDADLVVSQEMARIRMALESVAMPLTIADADNNLVFMNEAAEELWQKMQKALAPQTSGLVAKEIKSHSLVECIDDPEVRRIYRQPIDAPRTVDVDMCGHSVRVTATPVRDRMGVYLGRASQWIDRTEEMEIERKVTDIINAAAVGDFSRRIDVAQMSGFFKQISEGVNNLVEANGNSLADVGKMFARLSKGDLTQKIDAQYSGSLGELKDDANSTVDNLQEIILSIKRASDAIGIAAREIAAGNQELSVRTEEQANGLEQTASSMEQMTSTVRQNAENAKTANELACSAQQVAVSGGEVVDKVVETMSAIHQSSSRIADIIGVIDGIAFQTNILALNAAVEAARAGEQGRGFAVVATEVRNLAQRSANAAKEIKGLISESVDKVAVGNRLVNQAGRTMQEVVASVRRVAKIMTDISHSTAEQSQGIQQVTGAVGKMDEATQQNAALVEQAAAAAASLEEQTQQLLQAVAVFALPASVPIKPVATVTAEPRLALEHKAPLRVNLNTDKATSKVPVHTADDDEWAEF